MLDASGNPVPDAVVGGGLSLVNVAASGADAGRFTLPDVPIGRREIVAVSQSLQAQGRTTVDLVVPGETVNATVVLEPTASIAGVIRNRDGVAQAGVKVWVFTAPCYDKETLQESICVEAQTTTDANGAYRVDKLRLGTYSVSAFLPGFKDGNVGRVALRYAGQVLRNDITFRGGFGIVQGRVLRAAPTVCDTPPCTETPLAARVGISGERLVVAGGMVGVEFKYVQNYEVQSNDLTTGAFQFKNVWVGPVTVRAAGQFSPEPVAAETAVPGPGQSVTIDLRLQPTSRITGTVYDSDGFTPVTNRQISLKFKSDSVVVICTEDVLFGTECQSIPQGIQEAFASTDSQGRFVFPLVNAGPFTITATDNANDPDAQGKVAEIKGQVRAGDQLDVALRLLGRGRLTVRVFRSDGSTPVNGATVKIKQLQYPQREDSGVATGGTITFEGVSEGDYVVSAVDQNGNTNNGVIAGGRKYARIAQNNDNIVADVFLFDAAGTLSGTVTRTDAGNTQVPVPNAEVVVSNGSGPIAFAITDAQGQYAVDLVPPGQTSVEAFDPVTAGRGRTTVTVVANQPSAASVTLEALGAIRGTLLQSGLLTPLKGWTVDFYQWMFFGRALLL